MTTQLTPIAVGDQIISLPTSLAESINSSRQRFDAMRDDDEEDEEMEDEDMEDEESEDEGMSFAAKMKAAKAKKAAKKDSEDAELVLDHIDAIEAENEVLAALLQGYQGDEESRADADDEEYMDSEDMDMRSPQEIALEMMAGYEKAKPFLPMESTIADYGDLYDIYEDAISNRFPDLLMSEELEDVENMGRIDPDDADELRGAFLMMLAATRPMQARPMTTTMDSADRAFSQALGVRTDSAAMRPAPTPTAYY